MRLRVLFGLIVASLTLPFAVLAQQPPASPPPATPAAAPAAKPKPPRIPASAFAERSGLSDLQLSPDGNRIALKVVGKDGSVALSILDAADRKVLHNLAMPEKNEFEWFRWAGNGRVLVSLSQLGKVLDVEVRFTRLFVYDLQARTFSYVGKKHMGIEGDDLLYVDPDGQYVLLNVEETIFSYPAVWRFPLDGSAQKGAKMIQQPNAVFYWVTDSAGVVRMGFQFLSGGSYKVLYRSGEKDGLRTVASYNRQQWNDVPYSRFWIVPGSDQGYALHDDGKGHLALRRFNFSTFTVGEIVHGQPGYDLSGATFDRTQTPRAIHYVDDRDQTIWLEPQMKSLQTSLGKALKDGNVRIRSRADDNSRLLVWAGREDDPGVWYLYHAKDRRLDLFYVDKPGLLPDQLATPRAVSYTARDGVRITAYLTLPVGRDPRKLPLIILPHGGPYGVRDKLRFDAEAQFLANRGYAVLQPNFRGSGGYGQSFEALGDGEIGRRMQDDLDDGMDWAVAQGLVDPARVCVVGSSYGGYAALWAVIRNPERYRCAASFAGVTDFKAILSYNRRFLSRFSGRQWTRKVQGEDGGFNLDAVSPAKQAARLTRPVLLVHGEKDTTVPFRQFKLMRDAAARAGKPIEVLTFPDEGHGFDKAENEAKWFETLGAFLTRHNPAD